MNGVTAFLWNSKLVILGLVQRVPLDNTRMATSKDAEVIWHNQSRQ